MAFNVDKQRFSPENLKKLNALVKIIAIINPGI